VIRVEILPIDPIGPSRDVSSQSGMRSSWSHAPLYRSEPKFIKSWLRISCAILDV
jgi:hypothetical protein